MYRAVLDTSVLVAGLRSRKGASNLLLLKAARGALRPLVTTALFLEYEDVLLRPEQRLATGLDQNDVARLLSAFAGFAEPVDVHFRWRPQLADPADELVLEAAVNGNADALVTHNVRHFSAAAPRFRLRVLTPQQCLSELAD